MQNFIISQNSIYPRCVDGRAGVVFIEYVNNKWQVLKKNQEAESENGPQFLGASLLFVKALEELVGKSRGEAFDLTEQASRELGLGLQIHLDDAHAKYNFLSMSDQELLDLVSQHHGGCGFAKYSWGDEGAQFLTEAKKRHWRVQLLKGDHAEKGALINFGEKTTFNTAQAVKENQARFNTDVVLAEKMFAKLAELIDQPDFANQASAWNLDTYKDVVVALKGVDKREDVVELK